MILGLRPYARNLHATCIHWWNFEQATGTAKTDLVAGNNLSNTGVGGNEVKVTGLVGFATQVLFNAYLAGTGTVNLGATSDFTIVGAFKMTASSSSTTNIGLISQCDPKETQRQWQVTVFGNAVFFGVSTSGTAATNIVSDSHNVNDGAWHTYIAWRDTTNNIIALQIDGNTPVTAVFSGATSLHIPTGRVIVGGVGGDNLIDGATFDETGIFSRVLTAAERAFLYNGGAWRTYGDL